MAVDEVLLGVDGELEELDEGELELEELGGGVLEGALLEFEGCLLLGVEGVLLVVVELCVATFGAGLGLEGA